VKSDHPTDVAVRLTQEEIDMTDAAERRRSYLSRVLLPLDYLDSVTMPTEWLLNRQPPDAVAITDAWKKVHKGALSKLRFSTKPKALFAGSAKFFFHLRGPEDGHLNLGLTNLHAPAVMSLVSFGGDKDSNKSRKIRYVFGPDGTPFVASEFFGKQDHSICPIKGCDSAGQGNSEWISAHLRDHYGIAMICEACPDFATLNYKAWRDHCGDKAHRSHLKKRKWAQAVDQKVIQSTRRLFSAALRKDCPNFSDTESLAESTR
jgi:hypothetical protein